MHSTMIFVPNPDRYWLAARTDLPWLVDPDLQDGRQRHPDRAVRRWSRIAAAVESVGTALAAEAHDVNPLDAAQAAVSIDTEALEPADVAIVESWFSTSREAPMGDPWDVSLDNGRHRLWCCWTAAPDALLPVSSGTLVWLDSVEALAREGDDEGAKRLLSQVRNEASNGLARLPGHIRRVSVRYVRALDDVARGVPAA